MESKAVWTRYAGQDLGKIEAIQEDHFVRIPPVHSEAKRPQRLKPGLY